MAKQDKVNKFLRDLNFTQQTFSEDVEINRAEQTRRDTDNVKQPQIGLYHTDYAIKSFIEKVIEPYVEQDGEYVPVPVMYASPEKWAGIQRDGFMRDDKGKLITPVIVFNRTGMSRNDLRFNKVMDADENRILMKRKYTKFNRYDRWSHLTNSKPVDEYYSVDIPDFVDITYNMIIWCDYTTQVNHLTEQILYWSNTAWGETFKFMVEADNASFETTNNVGEDRIVRSTFDMTLKGRLLPKDVKHQSNQKKFFGPSKVVWNTDVVSDVNNISTSHNGTFGSHKSHTLGTTLDNYENKYAPTEKTSDTVSEVTASQSTGSEWTPLSLAGLEHWGYWNDPSTVTVDGSNLVQSYVDQSDNGYTIPYSVGAPTYTSNTHFVFDGTDDAINIDQTVNKIGGVRDDTQGTWAAWVKPNTFGAQQWIMTVSDGNNVNWLSMRIDPNGKFRAAAKSGGSILFDFQTQNAISASVWQHLMVTQDGTGPKLYVDNILETDPIQQNAGSATGSWVDALATNNTGRIGASWGDFGHDNFSIAEPLMYSVAYSGSNLTDIYSFSSASYI